MRLIDSVKNFEVSERDYRGLANALHTLADVTMEVESGELLTDAQLAGAAIVDQLEATARSANELAFAIRRVAIAVWARGERGKA